MTLRDWSAHSLPGEFGKAVHFAVRAQREGLLKNEKPAFVYLNLIFDVPCDDLSNRDEPS
jgi:hypothetical protein